MQAHTEFITVADYDFITGVSAGSMNAGYLSLYPKGNLTGGIADLEQHWLQINSNR